MVDLCGEAVVHMAPARAEQQPGRGIGSGPGVGVDLPEPDRDLRPPGCFAQSVRKHVRRAEGQVLPHLDALDAMVRDPPVLQAVGPELAPDPDAVGGGVKVERGLGRGGGQLDAARGQYREQPGNPQWLHGKGLSVRGRPPLYRHQVAVATPVATLVA